MCARAKKNNNAASRCVCAMNCAKHFEFVYLRRIVSLKKVVCFAAFVCVYLFVLLTDASRRQAGAPLRVSLSAPALFVGVISSNDLLCARELSFHSFALYCSVWRVFVIRVWHQFRQSFAIGCALLTRPAEQSRSAGLWRVVPYCCC
uniref:(northern house mosquito) hypothetical protein n=1 Tax=Culex pipiens TaxID=7175 RepID=A0A8D8ISQ5_CULPI